MFVTFFLSAIFIPIGVQSNDFAGMHPSRIWFSANGIPFPTDMLGAIAVMMWFIDWGMVLMRTFRYPVHLKTNQDEIDSLEKKIKK